MLEDLYILEQFYGRTQAAMFMESAIERYGAQALREAMDHHHIERRMVCIGPDCGKCLCYLTEEGRRIACVQ